MTPRTALTLAATLLLLSPAACGDSGGSTTDTAESDTTQTDTAEADTTVADTAVADTTAADTTAEDTAEADTGASDVSEDTVDNDLGFTIRYPATHHIDCEDPDPDFPAEDLDEPDADWLCTFDYDGASGHVYVQATPTGCFVTLSSTPVYDDCAGWIALDGTVSPVTDADYDWGGNHHNDTITFTWDGKRFTYDHSSFGWGFRQCQEMDCLVVRDSGGDLIEDGCTKDRTLPAVCRLIGTDGTWGSFEDTFEPCDGDPNYE